MTGKRSAHERFPQVIAAAVRVFARDGYRSAHMSDVAREAGLSEAAVYRYVDSKEGLFVLAIRHALLLEPLPGEDEPAGAFPLAVPSLELIMRELFALEEQTAQAADMIERSARELPALADLLNSGLRRPVLDALTQYLDARAKTGKLRGTPDTPATARLVLETLTWFARHRHSDPSGAAIPPDLAQDTAVDALLHALVPPRYLRARGAGAGHGKHR